jgi:hypothetical protein
MNPAITEEEKMKRMLGILSAIVVSTSYGMSGLPDTQAQGAGAWKHTAGPKGDYTVEMTIKDNHVHSVYQWKDGGETFDFVAEFKKNGFFTVNSEGHAIGEGYCGDVQCHFNVRVGAFELQETLTFQDGKVYRLGSKTVDGGKIMWQEALKRH